MSKTMTLREAWALYLRSFYGDARDRKPVSPVAFDNTTYIGPLAIRGSVNYDLTTQQTVIDFTDENATRLGIGSDWPTTNDEFTGIIDGVTLGILPAAIDGQGIVDLMASFGVIVGESDLSKRVFNPTSGVVVPRGAGAGFDSDETTATWGYSGPGGMFDSMFRIPGGAPVVDFKNGVFQVDCTTDNTRTGLTADVPVIGVMWGAFQKGTPPIQVEDPCACLSAAERGSLAPTK